jgi:hypothetical protein
MSYLWKAAEEWTMFDEVQGVVQVVMRKLQNVFTRDDRGVMS